MKTISPVSKWANRLKLHFSNEEIQMTNKYKNVFNKFSHQGNAMQKCH